VVEECSLHVLPARGKQEAVHSSRLFLQAHRHAEPPPQAPQAKLQMKDCVQEAVQTCRKLSGMDQLAAKLWVRLVLLLQAPPAWRQKGTDYAMQQEQVSSWISTTIATHAQQGRWLDQRRRQR